MQLAVSFMDVTYSHKTILKQAKPDWNKLKPTYVKVKFPISFFFFINFKYAHAVL